MQYKHNLEMFRRFTDHIQDEKSEDLLEARLGFLVDRDKERFYKRLDAVLQSESRKYYCGRLKKYFVSNPQNREKGIVIFGAGVLGKLTCRTLLYYDVNKVFCFCDNNKKLTGLKYKGIPICDFSYICHNFRDSVVVIAAAYENEQSIYDQLIGAGFKAENILRTNGEGLYCDIPNQYFEFGLKGFAPNPEGEWFVDAGCYDGFTSLSCIDWCNKNIKMIYAFEPDSQNYAICKKRLGEMACPYELYECATWDSETVLNFNHIENAGYGSRVLENGIDSVKADSIDHKLMGRKATFIKLDVEGSELRALVGAKDTLLTYRPKLAVSLYHKPEDIIEIPIFLEELDLDYRYYIRHYQTRMEETVLYAY